jgi:hypothetical protein
VQCTDNSLCSVWTAVRGVYGQQSVQCTDRVGEVYGKQSCSVWTAVFAVYGKQSVEFRDSSICSEQTEVVVVYGQ